MKAFATHSGQARRARRIAVANESRPRFGNGILLGMSTVHGLLRSSLRLPKSSASIDHAPGPSIAIETPIVNCKRQTRTRSVPAKIMQSSAIEIQTPATGVHRPTTKKTPARAAKVSKRWDSRWGAPITATKASHRRGRPPASLRTKRPFPGQPFGNIEYRRCKGLTYSRVRVTIA